MEDFDAFRELLLMRQQQQLHLHHQAGGGAGALAGGFHEAFDYLGYGDADDDEFVARMASSCYAVLCWSSSDVSYVSRTASSRFAVSCA